MIFFFSPPSIEQPIMMITNLLLFVLAANAQTYGSCCINGCASFFYPNRNQSACGEMFTEQACNDVEIKFGFMGCRSKWGSSGGCGLNGANCFSDGITHMIACKNGFSGGSQSCLLTEMAGCIPFYEATNITSSRTADCCSDGRVSGTACP